jgi:hypothetical protein
MTASPRNLSRPEDGRTIQVRPADAIFRVRSARPYAPQQPKLGPDEPQYGRPTNHCPCPPGGRHPDNCCPYVDEHSVRSPGPIVIGPRLFPELLPPDYEYAEYAGDYRASFEWRFRLCLNPICSRVGAYGDLSCPPVEYGIYQLLESDDVTLWYFMTVDTLDEIPGTVGRVTCSPKSDPRVMRVPGSRKGGGALDEATATQP